MRARYEDEVGGNTIMQWSAYWSCIGPIKKLKFFWEVGNKGGEKQGRGWKTAMELEGVPEKGWDVGVKWKFVYWFETTSEYYPC